MTGTRARAVAAALALTALALGGCATSGSAVVIRGGGVKLDQAMTEPAEGKYRIAVAPVIDKTGTKPRSIGRQLARLNAKRPDLAQLRGDAVTEGVRDMLVTELFGTRRFIVLDRAALDATLVEQEFSQSARAGDSTRVPLAQLEGAELVVFAAITSFDAGVKQSRLAIPFLFDKDDVGVVNLGWSKGEVVMDMRIVDVRTGRVVSSVAVRGTNSNVNVAVDAYLNNGNFSARLPGVLTAFSNTPVEKALQEMVTAAVGHVAQRAGRGTPAAAAPARPASGGT